MTQRSRKVYRFFLAFFMAAAIVAILILGYKLYYERIPAIIRLRVGMEQQIDLGIPATGRIQKVGSSEQAVRVSGQGQSNIPPESIYIDLSNAVTVKADKVQQYQMELKLFGFLPFKQVDIEVIQDTALYPVGEPVGIYVKTDGILVIGVGEFEDETGKSQAPAKYVLQTGDAICKVDGVEVQEKDEFISMVEKSNGEKLLLTVRRNGEETELSVQPRKNQSGIYKLGIWIRDNAQGVGTMTFMDEEGNFGALGHGISDVDTGTLFPIKSGTLYRTEIIAIQKGSSGNPGEMTGMIEYSDRNILGQIIVNSEKGIYGGCSRNFVEELDREALPIGLKQEIRKGEAQILCNVDGQAKYYDVEIDEIYLDHDSVNRGMLLTVTDAELLAITGGIIQGMSGSPIIQDGKLVGAVTHVLVNDPTRGYGIFIENMLDAAE